ncbi:TIGR04255 family protein [Parabacteroides sp.]
MDTIKRGIPIKIDNDGIVDSIVMLQFVTDYNQKKLDTELQSFLNKTLTDNGFFPTPLRRKDVKEINTPNKDGVFYSNGVLKVLIDGDKFVVNCLEEYPGWNDVLGKFVLGIINVFQQRFVRFMYVGVRYISILKNESLIENLDGEIKFNNFNVFNGANYNFTCSASDNKSHQAQIAVHLTEKAKYEGGLASIVDIEVNSNLEESNINTAEDVFEHLSYCHTVEKDIFYRLLSDSYVDFHNPVWK